MSVSIEGIEQIINKDCKKQDFTFDIVNNQLEYVEHYERKYNISIYRYRDYDLLFYPILVNKVHQYKFVLYNLNKRVAYALIQIPAKNDISIHRVNQNNFLVLCTICGYSTMHLCDISKNTSVKVPLGTMHQLSIIGDNSVLVNTTIRKNNIFHKKIILYSLDGTIKRSIYVETLLDDKKIRYIRVKNTLNVICDSKNVLRKVELK